MTNSYDHLYLSPHFDDAVLSCGGQIGLRTDAGESVLVVTITGGDPPDDVPSATVRALHQRWADSLAAEGSAGGTVAATMVAQRRAEDRAALGVLRAGVMHLPFLDCIYRCGPSPDDLLYPGPVDMFGPMNPADAATVGALVEAFRALPPAQRVYAPLGVGGHVDHLATRRAAEQVFAGLCHYEDYPYTARPGALAEVLPATTRREWTAETVWLTAGALAAKTVSVAAYRSQLSSFFTDSDDMAQKLREDGRRVMADAARDGETAPGWAVGAERLWRQA